MTPQQVQSAGLPLKIRRFVQCSPASGFFTSLLLVILSLVLANCNQPTLRRDQVSLTMIDQGWFDKEIREARDLELRQFTQETGIRVDVLPAPESAVEQIVLWKKLLASARSSPDILGIDVIWPALLADDLLDLKPYLSSSEISAVFPELAAIYTVKGKLVALPYRVGAGLLFYRTDLLQRYGYRSPPETWRQLEQMAAHIQNGERAKGNKEFWGFVWQGAPSEALTCNALEWQASEGGGKIIEDNSVISIKNLNTVRAWQRAAQWVGSISPPSVASYKEWDSFNIWRSGNAAFMRNWPAGYAVSQASGSAVRDRFGITALPRGKSGRAATLGSDGFAISRRSLHPQEALLLVMFLCRRDLQLRRALAKFDPPAIRDLYADPELMKAVSYFPHVRQENLYGVVARPATLAGTKYPEVSEAYFTAVHAVLTGRKSAEMAVGELQQQLARITGLREGSPEFEMNGTEK
jgi:trehalose/maltose transport system substrate-binding protein